jgi:uncharacterized protein YgiM (DUF1202 family)
MKRRFVFLLVVFAWLLSTTAPLSAGQNPYGEDADIQARIKEEPVTFSPGPDIKPGERIMGTVDVSTVLNVRSSPWGDIIGTLSPNAVVPIIGQIGDWYKIEYQGRTAYVHSAYIRRPGEGPKPFPRKGWVNAAMGVNIRRVPHGDILGTLKDQREVEILGVIGEYYKIKYGDNEAFVDRRYIDTNMPSGPAEGDLVKEDFIGFVSNANTLNVRKSPWGAIETSLPYGIAVKVTGRVNDWYQINYNGQLRYVHANFIVRDRKNLTPPGSGTNSDDSTRNADTQITTGSTGSTSTTKIGKAAHSLVGSTKFRSKIVDYGNKACAQVVSTALVNAGAMGSVVLNVRSVVSELKKRGWKETSVPPFKEGDVITWKTYDYTGDGVKDPDTHVGIMVQKDNKMMAMNNSSRLRTPRYSDPYSVGPITRVLRKP